MRSFNINRAEYRQPISELLMVMKRYNLKLLNVSPMVFEKMGETLRNKIAPRILTMGYLEIVQSKCHQMRSVDSFPKVEAEVLFIDASDHYRLKKEGSQSLEIHHYFPLKKCQVCEN